MCKFPLYIKKHASKWALRVHASTLTSDKSHLSSTGGLSCCVNNDELNEIGTINMSLSAPVLESSYPQGPKHKAAISLTLFSCLVQQMKRAQDNEADAFGSSVTMKGKHNCTPAWVSLETHYTVETCTHAHTHTQANTTRFPPIVITGNTKRSTTCDFKWHTHRNSSSL